MIIISIKREEDRKYNHNHSKIETVVIYSDIIKYLDIRIQINCLKQ